jgi:hypothetical protein
MDPPAADLEAVLAPVLDAGRDAADTAVDLVYVAAHPVRRAHGLLLLSLMAGLL